MKKTLFVALMVIAGFAQAGEINLVCKIAVTSKIGAFPYKISLDPDTNRGMIGDSNIRFGKSSTEYVIDEGDQVWRINRSTLEITKRDNFFNETNKGQCEIVKVQNKI
jgi:hypothetical protein